MGGVLRINQILKMYMDGDELQTMFVNGNEIWKKPIRSLYPSRTVDTDDDVLLLGSSDIGCLMGNSWSPVGHNWPNVFRGNYAGSFIYPFEGNNRYGMAAAVSYGRTSTPDVINNARNGLYAAQVNPFLSLNQYDTVVIDTSDELEFGVTGFDDISLVDDYYRYSRMARPFEYHQYRHQNWLNHEFQGKMELLRMCEANGVEKLFMMTPWPRLFISEDPIWDNIPNHLEVDALWYSRYFQNLEDSLHYQQDRLNTQIEFEGLTTHVSLIPCHLLIKRIYEDITAGIAPDILTSIRTIWAHQDNGSQVDPLDDSIRKHYYMLNYYGCYAINALYAAVVYKIDPRGYPRSDGILTVDAESAAYFQNIAWEISQTYGRAGQTRANPGYIMPKLRQDPDPAAILGDSLVYHGEDLPLTGSITLPAPAAIHHILGVLEIDREAYPSGEAFRVFSFRGASMMGPMINLEVNGNGRVAMSGGYGDDGWGGEPVMTFNLQFQNSPETRTGTVRVFFDVSMPAAGTAVNYGVYNHRLLITDLDAEFVNGQMEDNNFRRRGAHQTAGALEPVSNRLVMGTTGAQVLELIAIDHHMDHYEYQNVLRYMTAKYQSENIMELPTPDMV